MLQADEAADAAARASLESIFIAPGNPLGTTVVEAKVWTVQVLRVAVMFSPVFCNNAANVEIRIGYDVTNGRRVVEARYGRHE